MEGNPEKKQNVRTAVESKERAREGRGTVRVIRQWAVQFGMSAIEATAAESPPIRGRRSRITGWRRWSNRLWAITENPSMTHTPSPLLGGYRPGVHRTRSPGTCSAGTSVGIGTIPSVASDPTTHNQPAIVGTHLSTALCWTGRLAGRAPKKAVVTGTIYIMYMFPFSTRPTVKRKVRR